MYYDFVRFWICCLEGGKEGGEGCTRGRLGDLPLVGRKCGAVPLTIFFFVFLLTKLCKIHNKMSPVEDLIHLVAVEGGGGMLPNIFLIFLSFTPPSPSPPPPPHVTVNISMKSLIIF